MAEISTITEKPTMTALLSNAKSNHDDLLNISARLTAIRDCMTGQQTETAATGEGQVLTGSLQQIQATQLASDRAAGEIKAILADLEEVVLPVAIKS